MFGLVRRSTMEAAVARERAIGVEATAQAFEFYREARVAEEHARRWKRKYREVCAHMALALPTVPAVPRGRTLEQDAPVVDPDRAFVAAVRSQVHPNPADVAVANIIERRLRGDGAVPNATPTKPDAKEKPAAEAMPFVLAQQVAGWGDDWAREDVAELFDEARTQAGGSWQAVLGPITDPAAGIVAT